jgi:transposase
MRTKGSAEVLEERRRLAARMLDQGYTVAEVMAAVGASESSVKRWKRAVREGGHEALKAKPHAGKPWRLSAEQREELVPILLRGARAAGFANELWTCSRVAHVIEQRFGVKYHPDHVWKVLRRLGWSCQKPEQRARERNEEAIRRWRKSDWPRIKKEPRKAS